MNEPLTVEQAENIAEAIIWRQDNWDDENLRQSVMVVVLNHGSEYTKVACAGGEWTGIKKDLRPGSGLPYCPSGHVLFELGGGKRLALVEQPKEDNDADRVPRN